MQVRRFAPSAALAPWVRVLEIVEARDPVTRVLMPEPNAIVGLRYRGESTLVERCSERRVPDAVLTGPRLSARTMRTSAGGAIVLAKLHEAGGARFFTEPMDRFFESTLALDVLVPARDVERASARLACAESDAERIAILEQLLLARARPVAPDPIVARALRAIHDAPGSIRIGALARALEVSQDTLEARFHRVVGMAPKKLASLLRLRRALDPSHRSPSLAGRSIAAGYCDQSHFVRHFRAVTGVPPSQLLGTGELC